MGTIVTVPFRGAELYGFERPDGVFVALKPIADAIGLDWSAQYRRVRRDPILSEAIAMMATPFGHGGTQDAVGLRLDLVNGWLFTIDSARVRGGEVRERVLAYQRECYGVLAEHFLQRPGPLVSASGAEAEPLAVRRALVTEARQSFDAQTARELWARLGLPVTPRMATFPHQPSLFDPSVPASDGRAAA